MKSHPLLRSTRWRWAGCYSALMGTILGLGGLVLFEVMETVYHHSINREILSVTGALHDTIEPIFQNPSQAEPILDRLLPGFCPIHRDCSDPIILPGHTMGGIHSNLYYVRFFNQFQQAIAVAGSPPSSSIPYPPFNGELQDFTNVQGHRYRHLVVHLSMGEEQGYLEVGRSLADVDRDLARWRWVLCFGLLGGIGAIAVSSWKLSDLAVQPLYHSYQQIQQFTANAAHDLRSPLTAIRATIEAVSMSPHLEDADIRETLTILQRQNFRLTKLVDDLLFLHRLDQQEEGMSPVLHQLISLEAIVNDLVEDFAAQALSQQITLQWQPPEINLPLISGDPEQLYCLIANLVSNALNHTPAGGQVTLVLEMTTKELSLGVSDTGIGIAPQEQERIFERFYRVQGDNKGSGLGLAIARAIARSHQGTLSIHSELGQGSTFILRLPLKASKHPYSSPKS